MIKVLGVFKLFICFTLGLAALVAMIQHKYDSYADVKAVLIVALIAVAYLYYFSVTAIWNLNENFYKINILLLPGVLIHFALIAIILYDTISHYELKYKILISSIAILGIIAGVYDITKFQGAWKNRKIPN